MIHTRVCDLLGIRYPIVQAGMAGYVGPELVAAVSNAGGLGLLGPVTVIVITSVSTCGSWAPSTTTTPNTMEASPLGPNQPMNSTVAGRAREPTIAMATGTIRTTVRLSAA